MVGWVQLDNQTQDPVAPVVVAPTTVENPQATLQMGFIRNNAKSHSHLNHFEVTFVFSMSSIVLCVGENRLFFRALSTFVLRVGLKR